MFYIFIVLALAGHTGEAIGIGKNPYKTVDACKKELPGVAQQISTMMEKTKGAKVEIREQVCITETQVAERMAKIAEERKKLNEKNSI